MRVSVGNAPPGRWRIFYPLTGGQTRVRGKAPRNRTRPQNRAPGGGGCSANSARTRSFPSFASLPPAPATAVAKLWARSKSRSCSAVFIVGTTHAHPPPRIYIRLRQMLTGPAPHRNNRKNLKTQDGRKLRRHRGAGRSSGSSPGFTTSGAWWSATSGWWRTISAWCASGAS